MTYEEFRQRVRRFRPSDLLPALARASIEYLESEGFRKQARVTPWGVATAAKESILAGNEFRDPGATDEDVARVCAAYNSVNDPNLAKDSDLAQFLVRLGFEQFGYQTDLKNEMARIHLLFREALPSVKTSVITEASMTELLGCGIHEFIGAGFLLAVGAQRNGGYFEPSWLSQPNFAEVLERVSKETILRVFQKLFVTTFGEFKTAAHKWSSKDPQWAKFDYNPLKEKPYVVLPNDRFLAPVVQLVFQRMGPAAMYYLGVDRYGDAFARDLGQLFQHYVGRQLELLAPAKLISEIRFEGPHGGEDSVDWIAIWSDLVLLVEVKSTRLTQRARMGKPSLEQETKRTLGKAFDQIARTARLIHSRHKDFATIPTDRTMVGMVITLEPYYLANSPFVRKYLPAEVVPTCVAAISEVEHLVAVKNVAYPHKLILEMVRDPERRTWSLEGALSGRKLRENPLIAQGLKTYPWFDLEGK